MTKNFLNGFKIIKKLPNLGGHYKNERIMTAIKAAIKGFAKELQSKIEVLDVSCGTQPYKFFLISRSTSELILNRVADPIRKNEQTTILMV